MSMSEIHLIRSNENVLESVPIVNLEINKREFVWEELYKSKEYSNLAKARQRFIIPALIFFSLYFVSLLVLQGYFPTFSSTKVIGSLNISYLYAVSQLPVAWILCFCYIRYSQKVLDSLVEEVIKKSKQIDIT
jgi:uncharacterized membrane protein (DUF485 family)